MNNEFEVIDNALSNKDFDEIKSVIMHETFPWSVSRSITGEGEKITNTFYMTHMFYNFDMPQSKYFEILIPLLREINPSALVRIKANFYPNQNNFVEHDMHFDYDRSWRLPNSSHGAILYLNDNNGYTKLKNNNVKIESKENRLLLFDSTQMHCSTNCTDDFARLNINVNYYL